MVAHVAEVWGSPVSGDHVLIRVALRESLAPGRLGMRAAVRGLQPLVFQVRAVVPTRSAPHDGWPRP